MVQIDVSSLNYLDLIPDRLYQRLITHTYRLSSAKHCENSLQQRAIGILQVRQQLLNGKAPEYCSLEKWLDGDLLSLFYKKLNDKGLLKNAYSNESFTDDVLLHALNWLENIEDEIKPDNTVDKSVEKPKDEEGQSDLLRKVENDRFNMNEKMDFSDMQEMSRDFKLERHLGWDLSKGINTKTDLKLLVETHNKIKNSKKLKNIINLIGRGKLSSFDKKEQLGMSFMPISGARNDHVIPDEHSLNSVTGICYGDDISRMLSSEMAFLGNVKLKMLWHAKRAERQLLNYHFKGLMSEHVPEVQEISINHEVEGNHSIKIKGPVILCVDTSASMKGQPEIWSKAIALEIMRIAYLEKRSCYLFCFGGEDELMELELNPDTGWNTIIEFLSYRFDGGTDINNVLSRAYEKIDILQWRQADILLLSDGRFGLDKQILEKYKKVSVHSRVFGIQLGKWSAEAFNSLCHQVFNFSDV